MEYLCNNCQSQIYVPRNLQKKVESGKKVALSCQKCYFISIIERQQVVHFAHPRRASRWSGGTIY